VRALRGPGVARVDDGLDRFQPPLHERALADRSAR
jgi:hypothetical protein